MDGGGQVNPIEILRAVEAVLVIDWPSKEVPELLTRAGLNDGAGADRGQRVIRSMK
jgi:hypothetical protein